MCGVCVCVILCECGGMAGLQLKQRKPLRGEHVSSAKSGKAAVSVVPIQAKKEVQGKDRGEEQQRREKLVSIGRASKEGYACDDVDEVEEVLRGFDLDIRFGPCTGMTRMERWNRAEKLGLGPPSSIRNLLEAMDDGDTADKAAGDVGGAYAHNLFENRV